MARRIPWTAIAFGGAVIGVVGAIAVSSRKRPALPTRSRVALIGDSYAVGLGPELAKLLPDFKYEGHVGTNTAQWAHLSPACGQCGMWLTSFKPDVALVSLGVNDGTAPNSSNYLIIANGLRTIGARVVWIEPPAAVSTPSREIIRSQALGVQTVPGTTTPLAADGLHPRSYAPWAQEVAQYV